MSELDKEDFDKISYALALGGEVIRDLQDMVDPDSEIAERITNALDHIRSAVILVDPHTHRF
jgi:hypothetical protein